MSFNAVLDLADKETRQLTDASRDTFPMQRVDTDGIAHLRGERFCSRTCQAQGSNDRCLWQHVQ